MKRAEPYDIAGCLKPQWKKIVKLLDAKQEVVTVKILLEHYEISLVDKRTLVEELAALEIKEHTLLLEANSLIRTKLSAKTKEDMSLEQIPLPPSPLLQSTAYTND